MSKIKVGSLFKRPLVVGDPNLVTGNEILVDLDEDNKISSLKERTNEGLSDIVSSDSGSSDEIMTFDKLVEKCKEMGVKEFTTLTSSPEEGLLSQETYDKAINLLKPYVNQYDLHNEVNPSNTGSLLIPAQKAFYVPCNLYTKSTEQNSDGVFIMTYMGKVKRDNGNIEEHLNIYGIDSGGTTLYFSIQLQKLESSNKCFGGILKNITE